MFPHVVSDHTPVDDAMHLDEMKMTQHDNMMMMTMTDERATDSISQQFNRENADIHSTGMNDNHTVSDHAQKRSLPDMFSGRYGTQTFERARTSLLFDHQTETDHETRRRLRETHTSEHRIIHLYGSLVNWLREHITLFIVCSMTVIAFTIICSMMMPRQDISQMYGQCTTKVPPRWDPAYEADYDFGTWERDILMWVQTTELQAHQIGPSIILNLGGEARALTRELGTLQVTQGRQTGVDAQTGQPIMQRGYEVVLDELRNRFGSLVQEMAISAISEFFNFKRKAQEPIDEALTRFDIVRGRARRDGGLTISEQGMSWVLLNVLRIHASTWQLLLAPFNGSLPADAAQYRMFISYVRQNCHLVEKQADSRKSIHQPFFADGYEDEEDEDDEDDEYSSGMSNDDEEIDLSDVQHLSENAASEHVYLQYRFAKRRWRRMNPYHRGFRRRKGKGKHRSSFGRSFGFRGSFRGKGKGLRSQFFEDSQSQAQASGVYFRKNPNGSDGRPLKCSICGSEEHLRARCPKGKGAGGFKGNFKGKGKGKQGKPVPQTVMYGSSDWPEAWDEPWYEEEEQTWNNNVLNGQSQTARTGASTASSSAGPQNSETWVGFSMTHSAEQSKKVTFAVTPSEQESERPVYHMFYSIMSVFASVFGFWFHANVRLPDPNREGILVDTGAIDNIMSDSFFNRVKNLLSKRHISVSDPQSLTKHIEVDGVGKQANQCTTFAQIPVCMTDSSQGVFEAPIIQDSQIPALWGLRSLQSKRAMIDTYNQRIYFVGEQGYELKCSPGSTSLQLEAAKSGHLLLPVTEWKAGQRPGKKSEHKKL